MNVRWALAAWLVLRGSRGVMAQNRQRFDMISMKPSDPKLGSTAETRVDTLPGGRLVSRNVALGNLVSTAYDVKWNNLSGAPEWFRNTYDIDAIADSAGEQSVA